MTNYGPPGGGVPGPWRGQRPDETPGRPAQQPYPPAQQPYPPAPETYPPAVPSYPPGAQGRPGPYGDRPYGEGPGSSYGGGPYRPTEAAYRGESFRPDGPYGGDPSPPAGGRGRGPLIAVVAVVLLLVAAGGGAFWFFSRSDDPAPSAAPTGPAVNGDASADATAPVEPVPSAAAPESSADPRFVKVGQCVRNDGTAGGKPKLLISGCAPKSYEVLRRIDGATSGERDAEAKCAKVEGYTNWYFFDSELDTLDFVLCLKQR
ncbi:flagellar basal body protein FliL [Micromonospora sp. RHAY321]|nr:flagellar basal body protein FliL [Micromonospora sp. RHAY321]